LRRSSHAHDDIAQASFADLEIDFRQYRASKSGWPVALSPSEFEILRHFLRRRGEVVTREELLEQVFEDDAAQSKVDTYRAPLHIRSGPLGDSAAG
jgi:DNA-binding response OmpR family regulator